MNGGKIDGKQVLTTSVITKLSTAYADIHSRSAISEAEISEYVGTYTNKPESAEILVKEGRLVLKRENGEFPITKIGNYRFSIIKPSESEPTEFVLVRAADGKVAYLHIGRHAMRKVQAKK